MYEWAFWPKSYCLRCLIQRIAKHEWYYSIIQNPAVCPNCVCLRLKEIERGTARRERRNTKFRPCAIIFQRISVHAFVSTCKTNLGTPICMIMIANHEIRRCVLYTCVLTTPLSMHDEFFVRVENVYNIRLGAWHLEHQPAESTQIHSLQVYQIIVGWGQVNTPN